jgi:predicted pyridoxine 5'-phosphate oxidase superfamily flavin-nucleotide-binding protein
MLGRTLSLLLPSPTPGPSPPSTTGCAGERTLQERYGTRDRAQRFYDRQVLDHLNEAMRTFLARQQLMFVATSDAHGNCDNTFRSGPAGFVHVLDEHRLTWPEYRGNGVLASLGNITENGHVGLLFLDFVEDGVGLHVNGAAELTEDPQVDLPAGTAPGMQAPLWVVARVDEAYIHCAKFIPRMRPAGRAGGESAKKSDYFAGPVSLAERSPT